MPSRLSRTTIPLPRTAPTDARRSIARPDIALVIQGQVYVLGGQTRWVLGASSRADIRVHDPHVSNRHAVVAVAHGGVVVRDLSSTNGVKVGGAPVKNARVALDEAFSVGGVPVIVARVEGGRFSDAVCWRGMVSRDTRSLWGLSEIARLALMDAPVWIQGESGTGKEMVAQALHTMSGRRDGPWVALNCAALPEALAEAELFGVSRGAYTGAHRARQGAFQRAHRGTLFLDEVGELSPGVQAKLLRVLESGEVTPVGGERTEAVDVRVLTATWRDLEESAIEGTFRFDLLQRLWVLKLLLPALRDRPDDIPALLDSLLEGSGAAHLWPDRRTLDEVCAASWPGNVRQLRNHVVRAVSGGDVTALVPGAPGPESRSLPRRGRGSSAVGLHRIQRALALSGGNRAAAARALGVSRSTLYRWLQPDAPERCPSLHAAG